MGWMIFAWVCMVIIVLLLCWLIFITSKRGKQLSNKLDRAREKAAKKEEKKSKPAPKKAITKKVEPEKKPAPTKPIAKQTTKPIAPAKQPTKPIVKKPVKVIPLEEKWEDVWSKVLKHEGEKFATKMGILFVYKLEGQETLIISYPNEKDHVLAKVTKTQIENAFEIIKKCQGPTDLGPDYNFCSSYVYGILNDDRIVDYSKNNKK